MWENLIFFLIFKFLCGFGGVEAFQRVPGGCGYVLTKFGLKQTHLTLALGQIRDFVHFVVFSCITTLRMYFCAKETHAALHPYICVWQTHSLCCSPIYVWERHAGLRAGGGRAGGRANSTPTDVHPPHPRLLIQWYPALWTNPAEKNSC